MELHYRTLGKGQPVIILHGIFGTSDNWQTFGKQLAGNYQVFLVDQRNHGLSPHSDTFDYPAMAADLHQFIQQHQLENPVIIGHSMGGKVAMFYAVAYPEKLDKLVVVDIAPRNYPVHHQHILDAMSGVSLTSATSRKDIEEQLKPHLPDFGVRQFIMKNLKREDDNSFSWKLNLLAIKENIANVGLAVDNDAKVDRPTLFVRGENSDYIGSEDEELIRQIFPLAQIVTIENTGHWVHAEQPKALYEVLLKFLSD